LLCSRSPESGDVVLSLKNVCKRFGGLVVTDDVSLDVVVGQIHALIGPNGAGKSTLANQIAGDLSPDSGAISVFGTNVVGLGMAARARCGLARSYQIVSIFGSMTVLENVMLAVQARLRRTRRFWSTVDRDNEIKAKASELLSRVGLDPNERRLASALSHGEQRQLEIALTLAGDAKLLILDEPLAGMGPIESKTIIGLLNGLRANYGILLIEHDMDAVFALADRISVLVYGRIVVSGTVDEIRTNALVREAYLGEEA
jgi:branched-chain amino acid transport system ATP-binding protein